LEPDFDWSVVIGKEKFMIFLSKRGKGRPSCFLNLPPRISWFQRVKNGSNCACIVVYSAKICWFSPKSSYNRVEIGFSLPGPTNAFRPVSNAKSFEPFTINWFWKVKEKVNHI
jgi:hypothetical protein